MTFSRAGQVVALAIMIAGMNTPSPAAPTPGLERFYIGTYTGSGSVGIYQSGLNLGTGAFGATNLAATSSNPSFVALTPNRKFLYAVDENGAAVRAFSVNPTNGALTFLNSQPSNGGSPAHVVVDNTGKQVIVANYGGGSITMFPIQANGSLGAQNAHFQHPSGALAHCTTIDSSNRYAFVCDKGLSQVRCYVLDAAAGTLVTNTALITQMTAGCGTRHMAFDPQFKRAYVICELNSTIVGFDFNPTNGVLTPFSTNSTLPAGFGGANTTAEIAVHPTGKFVYGSNRGHNSIVVFTVNPADGKLTLAQHQSTGTTPRSFAIDPAGAFCIVANQDSNNILLYSINPQTGQLTATGQSLSVSRPVCVVPFIIQPPQPVLIPQPATNAMQVSVSNSLDLLTYQIYQRAGLSAEMNWSLLTTGSRGQTNFMLSNALAQAFFRAGVLTNF